jgi:hypothetical protein
MALFLGHLPDSARVPASSVNVRFCPNRDRGAGGLWRGGGRVGLRMRQVAGIFEGRDDDGADGGQVGRSAAGAIGGRVFAEAHVADVMVRLFGPVLADKAGQVLRGGLGTGQAGNGVDGLAGGLPVAVSCRHRVILMVWRPRGSLGG